MARVVQVRWCKPFPFDNFSSHRLSHEVGLYQIVRYWAGIPSLAYIGIVWTDDRTLGQRMHEHRRDWIDATRGSFELRFGSIESWKSVTVDRQLLEEIEGALILHHQPPFNSKKRRSFSLRKELVLKNTGFRGFLDPQIDTETQFD